MSQEISKTKATITRVTRIALLGALVTGLIAADTKTSTADELFISPDQAQSVIGGYLTEHPGSDADRYKRGVRQVADMWRAEDGTVEDFRRFCTSEFITDPELLQKTFDRLESSFASIEGYFGEMGRELTWHLAVATGPILPIDQALALYAPEAHVDDDLFETKIAFIILLNFPRYTLEEKQELGPTWTREQWARARLAERIQARVPAEVQQKRQQMRIPSGNYMRDYNIWMHHLLDKNGRRPFPAGMKLISHWNLRDELKSLYAEADGLPKQAMIYDAMLRIIRQEVPQAVINNPAVDWKLSTNEVWVTSEVDGDIPDSLRPDGAPGDRISNQAEPNTRYECLLRSFHSQQLLDPYYPATPSLIDRRFQSNREMPEAEVEAMFNEVLDPDLMIKVGKLIEKRLGRQLQPFDIWYDGFNTRSTIADERLTALTKAKYPTPAAFEADMPRILAHLGFSESDAAYVAARVRVDPSRGAGHAAGPPRRDGLARLRTQVGPDGMDYKGYNIAIHEFGHNVEQVFSSCLIDHTLLAGVPNTAFTEAFAFTFQDRDLELLGLETENPERAFLHTLDVYWGLCEITTVSLVDMRVWHWMYDHPDAGVEELKSAVISIAQEVWNEYYAPVMGVRDVPILAIYSHMITGAMYLPDYAIAGVIQFQVEQYLKNHTLGSEMKRMCTIGSVVPDLWMRQAVGTGISAAPLLAAVEESLRKVN